jgi:Tol biopolymer transport system component
MEAAAGATNAGAAVRAPSRHWLFVGVGSSLVLAAALVYWTRASAPHAVTSPTEYQPLTDVDDSATAAVLSPDGRMLAFIRDGSWLLGSGQVWLKALPDGDYVRLTNSSGLVFAPTFSPDGTRVAYTVVDKRGESWDTWTVPVTGGAPSRLLPNATGLTFIGPHEYLYSQFKTGIHLGVATSKDDRAGQREIYLPAHERAMAHFSYLSPDRSSVLIVEMDGTGSFRQCRVVPFAGGSGGTPVGPARGACIAAAWAPDGKWMYFTIGTAGHSHLWRQRFPDGEPQQITFGPTDEEGVFVAPDGRSLLTSIGTEQNALWLHTPQGERALTTEGSAYYPWLSADARRVYYMSGSNSAQGVVLARIEIATGRREVLLQDFNVGSFDLDADERHVVYTVLRNGIPQVWLASLDKQAPPRLLVHDGDQAQFGGGRVYYRSLGKQVDHLHRIDPDGGNDTRVVAAPIVNFDAVSPDGNFVIVDKPVEGGLAAASLISMDDHSEHLFGKGWYQSRWSRDGKLLLVEIGRDGDPTMAGRTAVVRMGPDGRPVDPILPVAPDAIVIPHPEETLSAGQDASVYVYVNSTMRRNIFRIPLH